MGVNALTTRIVLQDLLQKQYEGLSFVVLGKCSENFYPRTCALILTAQFLNI